MGQARQFGNKSIFSAAWLTRIAATILLGTMLPAVPAWAVHFVGMKELDVNCGSGMHLNQATGVPGASVHTYAFGGACDLRVLSTDGPVNVTAPPLVASAHWDLASKTYTESLHLLGATTVTHIWTGQPDLHLTTYPEVGTFRCDVDPVIHLGAHCSLESQYDDTGWHSSGDDQVDGFAWKANHNRPLLLGLATEAQAASLSHKNKHSPISCDGLKLVSVHLMPKSITRRYHFDGTCELYHTEDGTGGLRLTHVFVTGFWNANGQEAQETFTVAAPGNEGGGLYRLANYTCSANPFIHGNVQCSLEKPLAKVSPVYDPISDLRAKHPIAAGRANPAQVAKLLNAEKPAKKRAIRLSAIGASHKGSASASRKTHMPKPKFSITGRAYLTRSCAADKLVLVKFSVHDDAGFYHPAGGNLGYIEADENGGAGLKSKSVGLPAMIVGNTWRSTLQVGTKNSAFAKLPGTHQLVLHIGPTNALKSSLAYVPPLPLRLTVTFPAGYCQTNQRKMSNAPIRLRNGAAASKRGLPAVQQHANVSIGGKLHSKPLLHRQAPAMHTMSGQ